MNEENSNLVQAKATPSVIIDKIGFGRFQWILFIGMSSFSLAATIGICMLSFLLYMIDKNWNPSTAEIAVFGALMNISMAFGAWLSMVLEPRFGRWKILRFSYIVAIAFSVLSTFVPGFYPLLISRVFILTGLFVSVSPTYSSYSEMIPSNYRGMFLAAADLIGSTSGLMLWGYLYVFIPDLEGEGWRVMQLVFGLVFSLPCLLISWLLIEESPVYQWENGQLDAAKVGLARMAFINQSENVESDIDVLEPKIMQMETEFELKMLFKGKYRNVWWILWGQWFIHSLFFLSGSLIYPYLLGGEELDASETLSSFLVYSVAIIPMAFALVFMVDAKKLGRRPSFFILSIITEISLVIPIIFSAKLVLMICMAMFLAAEYALLMLIYIVTPEIYETALRNSATSFYGLSSRIPVAGLLYALIFLIEASLTGTLITLGVLNGAGLLTLFWLKQETKGVLLDQDNLKSALFEEVN